MALASRFQTINLSIPSNRTLIHRTCASKQVRLTLISLSIRRQSVDTLKTVDIVEWVTSVILPMVMQNLKNKPQVEINKIQVTKCLVEMVSEEVVVPCGTKTKDIKTTDLKWIICCQLTLLQIFKISKMEMTSSS